MLSTAAFNALLKTLEEPPPHAIFVLATTEVHKIPATVLSRCQRHEFRRIPVVDIVAHLENMAKEEGLNVPVEVLQLVARQATGSMRDAISLLDQLSALGSEITLDAAQAILGTATSQSVLDLIDAIQENDPAKGMDTLHASLDAGSDPRQFARQVVDYLRGVMLVRMGNADQVDTTSEVRQHMARHAQRFESNAELLRIIRAFNQAATEARGAWQPSLPLELAIVEALSAPSQAPAQVPATAPQAAVSSGASTPTKAKGAAKATAAAKEAPPVKEGLGKQWATILQLVREANPNTTGLLNSNTCQYAWEHGVLSLYFGSELLKNKMEEESHLGVLKTAAEQVLKETVEIHCYVSSGKGGLPPGVDSTGRVAAVIRLGGQIVDINDLGSGGEAGQKK